MKTKPQRAMNLKHHTSSSFEPCFEFGGFGCPWCPQQSPSCTGNLMLCPRLYRNLLFILDSNNSADDESWFGWLTCLLIRLLGVHFRPLVPLPLRGGSLLSMATFLMVCPRFNSRGKDPRQPSTAEVKVLVGYFHPFDVTVVV